MMRTTLILDADVADRLQRMVRRSGKSLKGVVNEALRTGLGLAEKPEGPSRFRIRTFVDGLQPGIDPEEMNQMADEIEAAELAGMRSGAR